MSNLLDAAREGDIPGIQEALKNGANLAEKNNDGDTALLLAARYGHLKTVQWLLGNGASLAEKNNNGYTAMLLAALGGKLKTVQWLLDHEASLAEKNNEGDTALLLSAWNGNLETVEWLLDHGASLAEKNKRNQTLADLTKPALINPLLTWALSKKDPTFFRRLFNLFQTKDKVHIHQSNNEEQSLLASAFEQESVELFQYIVSYHQPLTDYSSLKGLSLDLYEASEQANLRTFLRDTPFTPEQWAFLRDGVVSGRFSVVNVARVFASEELTQQQPQIDTMTKKIETATEPTASAASSLAFLWTSKVAHYLDNPSVANLSSSHSFFFRLFKGNLWERKRMALIEQPALFDPHKILDIIAETPSLLFKKIHYTDRYGETRHISPYQLMIASYHFILIPLVLKTARDNMSSDEHNALLNLAENQHREQINTQPPFINIDKFNAACTAYLAQCALPPNKDRLRNLWEKNPDGVAVTQRHLPTGLLVLFFTELLFFDSTVSKQSNLNIEICDRRSSLEKEQLPTVSLDTLNQAADRLRASVVNGDIYFGSYRGPDTLSRTRPGRYYSNIDIGDIYIGEEGMRDDMELIFAFMMKTCKRGIDWFKNTPPSTFVELSSSPDDTLSLRETRALYTPSRNKK